MSDSFISEYCEDHSRTIIHIDCDCFYAQVEMIKNPALYDVPLGVKQKSLIVTCNYVARERGIQKCMQITEALKICPNLVIVNGEDLHPYRQLSYKITTYLQKYSNLVERLGLDENFIDASNLVSERLKSGERNGSVVGHVFGDTTENCLCGCSDRLLLGTKIAQEIRNDLNKEFKLTCSAGVAHNKVLAKLVGAVHKPNQQTLVFPNSAVEFMLSLKSVKKIPGIGKCVAENLESIHVSTVSHLQNCSLEKLKSLVGVEKAKVIRDISFGIDISLVKSTGRPQSIGLEDSCVEASLRKEEEIAEKFQQLLKRLMILLGEDGRIPRTIKLTIRKHDNLSKISHKETRQCNVSSSLFARNKSIIFLTEKSEEKLLSIIMNLFKKLVKVSKPYRVTLLGLAFTKFQEYFSGKNSITSFLSKDVAVQSVTCIENRNASDDSVTISNGSPHTDNTDGSESDLEPSPKKLRFNYLVAKRRCLKNMEDCSSPSKLKVAELRLNSKDSDDKIYDKFEPSKGNSSGDNMDIKCPPNADKEVFRQLPSDMQQELWQEWKRQRHNEQDYSNKQAKKSKTNTLLNYFAKN